MTKAVERFLEQIAHDQTNAWWRHGVRFECRKRGCCCVTHGDAGYVFLPLQDRLRLAAFLGVAPSVLVSRYCVRIDGRHYLMDAPGSQACAFLGPDGCTVYEARPTQCRTWPFWLENMSEEAWARTAAFCPGIGRGRLWTASEIAAQLRLQLASDFGR